MLNRTEVTLEGKGLKDQASRYRVLFEDGSVKIVESLQEAEYHSRNDNLKIKEFVSYKIDDHFFDSLTKWGYEMQNLINIFNYSVDGLVTTQGYEETFFAFLEMFNTIEGKVLKMKKELQNNYEAIEDEFLRQSETKTFAQIKKFSFKDFAKGTLTEIF